MSWGKYAITRRRVLPLYILGVGVLALIILFAAFPSSFVPEKSKDQVLGESASLPKVEKQEALSDDLQPEEPQIGLPVRLIIPKLNLNANILYLGLTDDGDMDVPERIEDLGWYKHGPRPGEKGSAVIAGHYGVGELGVFVNLDKLQQGDIFSVIDENDQTISFVVKESRIYRPDEHPSEVFFSKEGYHLNLITCAGEWQSLTQQMTERLVVFADMI